MADTGLSWRTLGSCDRHRILIHRTWILQLKWEVTLVAEMQRDRMIIDVQFKSKIVEYKNDDCINGK